MKKVNRVKDNRDFQKIFNNRKSFANRQLVIYFLEKPNQKHFRVGLSVGKRIGNAVMRNRIKRYLRQAFHELEENINPAIDIIVIARQPVKDMTFFEIKSSLVHVLKRQRLLNK